MVEAALLTRGWHLSKEGLEQCKNGLDNLTADNIIKKALDIDLRHIGVKFLPPDLNKGKVDLIQGPCVVQIQKVRNVSAPKMNEDSGGAPPLLRLQLSDGHGTCFALVMHSIQDISLGTTPGTKLQLKGSVRVNQGYLLLTSTNAKSLGGTVEEMVARWQLQRTLAHHTRLTGGGEGGPPPWVSFGQRGKVKQTSNSIKNGRTEVKKSLESKEKPKELTEQDKEFEEQRKATIEEVRKAKGQGKTFGGAGGKVGIKGKDNQGPQRSNSMDSSKSWSNGTRDEESRGRNDSNYRELSYGGFQPSSQAIQQLMGMGFSRDASVTALKKHSGNVNQAIESLLDQTNQRDQTQTRGYAGRSDRRPDTGRRGGGRLGGRGRGSRDQDDTNEEGDISAAPSGPSTLFDFLESKLPKDKQKNSRASGDSHRNYANEQPKSVKEAGIKFMHGDKDDSSDKGQRSYGDRDYGNRSRYQDSKEDRTRDGQRNRSDGPKGNRDTYKSGPGRGYDDRPPRFRNTQDGNRQRNQDRFEKPDRTKRQDETDRQKPGRNYDSRNSQNYEDKKSRNYDDRGGGGGRKFEDGRNTGDERKGRSYNDRGGSRKFEDRRERGNDNQENRNYDHRENRNYNNRENRNYDNRENRNYDNRENRNYNNRENRTYDDRRNQNNRERDRTKDQGQGYRTQQSSQRTQSNAEPNKSNKSVRDKNEPSTVNKNANTKQQHRYSKSSHQNGGAAQEQNQDNRYAQSNGSVRQDSNQGVSNGTPSPPQQQHQQPPMMAVPSPLGQPMISQAMTMMPPPHSLPVQPLPGQPPPMVSGQMLPPQGLLWKQGDVCQAKYWEDGKFYNAVVTAIHPSGRTCVVHFMEYGNYEEVDVNDMRPTATQAWIDTSQPPPPFQPPGTMAVPMVYENFEGPITGTMEFRRGGQGSFRRPRDERRVPARPTQTFYQPPTVRR